MMTNLFHIIQMWSNKVLFMIYYQELWVCRKKKWKTKLNKWRQGWTNKKENQKNKQNRNNEEKRMNSNNKLSKEKREKNEIG